MRLCIPTSDTNGWDARVANHFGRAPHFAVVDSQTRVVEFVDNRGRHQGGHKPPVMTLLNLGLDAVICSGMGPRAMNILRDGGVQVFAGARDTLGETLDQFEAGALSEATDETACKEGRHSH